VPLLQTGVGGDLDVKEFPLLEFSTTMMLRM
jgi:hypothetical protein